MCSTRSRKDCHGLSTESENGELTRRSFLQTALAGAVAGASLLELAQFRAAWAQSIEPESGGPLFDIEKVTENVFYARARLAAVSNCNAAIFVNSRDVLVVDAHSKPSAAASLIAQIRNEVSPKPVRYLVDTHFHWDHTQGNDAYAKGGAKIYASKTTRRLMVDNVKARLHETLDPDGHGFPGQPRVPVLLEAAKQRLANAASEQEKDAARRQIRQLESFAAEMKGFEPALPGVIFDKSYVIKDSFHDIHLQFRGRAHTAGDIVLHCPRRKVVATGDAVLGQFPFITDGYPKEWPRTIDSIGSLEFDYVLPGHGRVQQGRMRMTNLRNYIEELTERVESGKRRGSTVADLQKSIAVESLKSLESDGYGEFLSGPAPAVPLQPRINNNIDQIYGRLEKS